MKKLLLAGMLATLSLSTYAVTVTVSDPTCTGAYATGTICADLKKAIQDQVDGDLPEVSIGDYGTGLANANGFAQKGLGSDYSDKFTYFMVRGGAGAAVDGELDKPESAAGFGIGAAATFGLNLDILPVDKIGPVELSKLDVFISMMSYSVDTDSDDFSAKGDFSAFSAMARYQIIEGKDIFPGHMLEWGGLFVHTGIQRSTFKADLTSSFKDQTVTVSGQDATFGDSSAKFSLETTTTSIPFEVSTYLRTVWALTFFGGAGFDLVNGSTDVDLTASGTVSGSTGGTFSSTISASESADGKADATNFRAFGGLQFNLPFFRIYAQANKGLGNDLVGVNVGAKILW